MSENCPFCGDCAACKATLRLEDQLRAWEAAHRDAQAYVLLLHQMLGHGGAPKECPHDMCRSAVVGLDLARPKVTT